MTSRRTAISAIPIIATILVSTPVLGDDFNCQTDYGNVNLDGNVMVAAPCTLNGTTVEGNIKLFAGGSLVAIGAVIDGNIMAKTADFIDLQNTEVKGNVKLDKMVGDISYIRDSTIDGNVELKNNRSRLELLRNYIDNNLQAFENSGGVVISDNVIDGNLQCKNNNPEPKGGNNMVSGKKEHQCRDLQAATDTGGSGNDGGTGTTDGSETPPFEINTGTAGAGRLDHCSSCFCSLSVWCNHDGAACNSESFNTLRTYASLPPIPVWATIRKHADLEYRAVRQLNWNTIPQQAKLPRFQPAR